MVEAPAGAKKVRLSLAAFRRLPKAKKLRFLSEGAAGEKTSPVVEIPAGEETSPSIEEAPQDLAKKFRLLPAALRRLPDAKKLRLLPEAPAGPDGVDMLAGEETSPDAERLRLAETLAYKVADHCHAIHDYTEEIRALWSEFDKLQKGETILTCRTRTEFTHKWLGCTMRAVQLALINKRPAKLPPNAKYKQDDRYDEAGDVIVKGKWATNNERIRRKALEDLITNIIGKKKIAAACGVPLDPELAEAVDEAEHFLRYGVDAEHRI